MTHRLHPVFAVAIISQRRPPLELLIVTKSDPDADTNSEDQQDNCKRTQLFGVAKCVAILKNTGASVSVTTSIAELIYIARHSSSMQEQMVLLALGIVIALQQ